MACTKNSMVNSRYGPEIHGVTEHALVALNQGAVRNYAPSTLPHIAPGSDVSEPKSQICTGLVREIYISSVSCKRIWYKEISI